MFACKTLKTDGPHALSPIMAPYVNLLASWIFSVFSVHANGLFCYKLQGIGLSKKSRGYWNEIFKALSICAKAESICAKARESGTHLWGSCNIQQYPSEYQISFAHVSSYVSSWNFAQSTVITLTCSVQNFKTIQPHFPRYWHFERGIHRSPVNSPHKGRWRGASMFSLICAWINGWVYNGDFRRWFQTPSRPL